MTFNCLLRYIVIYHLIYGETSSLVFSWSTTTLSPYHHHHHHHRCDFSSSSSSSRSLSVATASAASGEGRNDKKDNNNNDILTNENEKKDPLLNRRSAVMVASYSIATFGATAAVWTRLPLSVQAATVPTTIPSWTLDGGVVMPLLALNTVGLSMEGTERAITLALRSKITHVDFHPGKERDGVAKYLADGGDRSKLFLNTKLRGARPGTTPTDAAERVRRQIDEDLAILNVKSVDMLMLRDSPDKEVIQSQWAALEDALQKGQTRSIGVINFCEFSLKSVLQTAKIKPALNYYLNHVGMGLDPKGLRSYGESRGIRTFAYGAVGEPAPNKELLESPILNRIAINHKVSPEAVALRWILQTGAAVSVRPTLDFGLGTSTCPLENNKCDEGLQERAATFNWKLTTEEMDELSAMTSPNDNPTLFSSAGCPDAFGAKQMIGQILK